MDTMASSPSQVLQLQPFLEHFCTCPAHCPLFAFAAQRGPSGPRAVPKCDDVLALGLREVGANHRARPVTADAQVVRCTHGAVSVTIQRGGGLPNTLDQNVREVAEERP